MTRPPRPFFGLLVISLALVACTAGGAASSPPASSPSASPSAAASVAPPASAQPSASAEAGEVPPPGIPDSELVRPQPGQQNVMSIPIERLEASASGRTVTITAHWSSGVAPCSVLDQVLLDVSEGSIAVTIREGTSDPNAMCVMMLQAKRTIVSLEVEPGTYVVVDGEGQAEPVEVTVG